MKEKNREIPVMINLASLISYNGMNDDPIQVMTTGKLIPREKDLLLQYRENMEDTESGETIEEEVQLILKKDEVTVNRMGDYANTMMFQQGKRFETVYRTPFGEMPMSVFARDVKCDLKKERGKVHLRYEISMEGAYASTNELNLEYWQR